MSARDIAAVLDREEAQRSRALSRALDRGCGRGVYTAELAARGWQAVGVDCVQAAVEAAGRRCPDRVSCVVGDVTNLSPAGLGMFDFFLDVGCRRVRACRTRLRASPPPAVDAVLVGTALVDHVLTCENQCIKQVRRYSC